MKRFSILTLTLFVVSFISAQETENKVDLGNFTMSNDASSAFILLEETPTAIYTTNNLKALSLHVLNNLGQSLSIEVAPYFLINRNDTNKTYKRYMGIQESNQGELSQDVFSGLNTTTLSFGYVDKEFAGIGEAKKSYAVGFNTTLLRWYSPADLKRLNDNTNKLAEALTGFPVITMEIMAIADENERQQAIAKLYVEHYKGLEAYKKTYKPTLRLDGAMGYSALFKENNIDSETANRFGVWLTGVFSLLLNEGSEAKTNNYCNLFATGRYVEDGFNTTEDGDYQTWYYRDLGGKLEFEFGALAFSYEFLKRSGVVDSERSVGTIKYTLSSSISINGGFGKDFGETDNLISLFGIHWGLNMGGDKLDVD